MSGFMCTAVISTRKDVLLWECKVVLVLIECLI